MKLELAFQSAVPGNLQEVHHHSWGHNILARYYCYQRKDYSKSLEHLILATGLAKSFWKYQFEAFDTETKCIPLIVALNVARLKFHAGEQKQGETLIRELEAFLNDTQKDTLPEISGHFPYEIDSTFQAIHKIMNDEIRQSFTEKIAIEKQKWNFR